ncbi:MAG: hypothetical protein R3C49_23795 [Planctomycetaceae bacterium]
MIRLFTSYYHERHPVRQSEIDECLRRNLECSSIDKICILQEPSELPFQDPRIQTRPITERPRYADFFLWIDEVCKPSDISIIANSDLYFDQSLQMVKSLVRENTCLALSRWDVMKQGRVQLFERGDSQDCWIVRGPVHGVSADFPIGVYDCDNRIAWEFERAGYRVVNPAFSLRTYHLHRTRERSYDPTNPTDHGIRPPFRYVEPDNAGNLLSCASLWWQYRPGYFPWRLTSRKLARTLPGRIWSRITRMARLTCR